MQTLFFFSTVQGQSRHERIQVALYSILTHLQVLKLNLKDKVEMSNDENEGVCLSQASAVTKLN
jgi:hypothetical protein